MSNIEFNQYADLAAYEAAAKPTTASRISEIADSGKMAVDGVNVITTEPTDGDALYFDADKNLHALKGGDQLIKSLVPSGWTLIGTLYDRQGDTMKVHYKTEVSRKFAAYAEYSITAISSTSITIRLRLSNNYDADTAIDVTLADTSLNATNAAAINDAIEAKCTEVSATNVPWAYYDETNNKIVIVTVSAHYRQFTNVSGTGCTIALSIWDDMPANSNAGFRSNGLVANERFMNIARAVARYGTNGVTPTANVALNASATPVTKAAFESSEYCTALRAAYSNYTEYIEKEYKLMYPQVLGAFSLPDAKTLSDKYADRQVMLKDGTYAYAFPTLHYGKEVGFTGVEGFEVGDWYTEGVSEGAYFMQDDVLKKMAATQSKLSVSTINNSSYRWFAQRYGVYCAWFFYGYYGNLDYYNVSNAYLVGAVSLLNLKKLG